MVCDPILAQSLIEQRRRDGLDRHDEVWDGVYVMSPIADNEHQGLATKLATVLTMMIDFQGLGHTLAGANVTDRHDDWTKNYRVPDVLVFRNDTTARNCDSHWLGGPDFAIEIVSRGDRTLEKLDFYSSAGVQELLVIDREPWKLTLYRTAADGQLAVAAADEGDGQEAIKSRVLPIAFLLDADAATIHIHDDQGELVRSIPTRHYEDRSS